MKSLAIFLFIAFGLFSNLLAQKRSLPMFSYNPEASIRELPPPPQSTENSYYIDKDWSQGAVLLKNGKQVSNVNIRFNLEYDLLEVKDDKSERTCPLPLLIGFYTTNGYDTINYVNAGYYDRRDTGIYKVIFEKGENVLVKSFVAVVKEPNYILTHDVGFKEKRVVVKNEYYLFTGGKREVIKRNKKMILQMAGEHKPKVEKYIKENSISLKNDTHLIRLLGFYADLLTAKN